MSKGKDLEEAQFVAECLRWTSPIRTGISSDAMIAFALDGREPHFDREYPHDRSDLDRCERIYEVAPGSMQRRMRPVLLKFRQHGSPEDGS